VTRRTSGNGAGLRISATTGGRVLADIDLAARSHPNERLPSKGDIHEPTRALAVGDGVTVEFGDGATDRYDWTMGQRPERPGIAHGEIVGAHYGVGVSVRAPDNIELEFFAPPA
jgi:hypothetical protein